MAKYISNNLDNFEFHDAEIIDAVIEESDTIWTLNAVNVKKDNTNNNYDSDMEAGTLRLTFKKYRIQEFTYGGVKTYDRNGNLLNETLKEIVPESKYLSELKLNIWISRYISFNSRINVHEFETIHGLRIKIKCSEVVAEWDEYVGKAWYVGWPNKQ